MSKVGRPVCQFLIERDRLCVSKVGRPVCQFFIERDRLCVSKVGRLIISFSINGTGYVCLRLAGQYVSFS